MSRFALHMGTSARFLALGGLACLLLVARASVARDGAKPPKSVQGGLVAKTDRHQFEVFFYPTGIRLFPKDADGKAIDASKVSAIAIFYHANSPSPWFDRRLRTAPAEAGKAPTSLKHEIGLSAVPTTSTKVVFEVSGLDDSDAPATTFTVPFEFVTGTEPAPEATASEGPRYVYASGFQGVGYYANPGPQTAPAATPTQAAPPRFSGTAASSGSRGSTAGPGTRDWSTGRRNRLHKPWLSSR